MGPFQPSRGCLHSKTTSLNVIPGQVDVKHICNKLLKSQHDQATPLASTRGVVSWGVRVGEAVGPFQPNRGCLHSKTTSLNVIPGQVDVKHI